MLEILKEEINKFDTAEEKLNHLREYLQILILKIIYEGGFFKNLSFTGGTALRVIYNIRRFSEDMDFSLVQKKGYEFKKLVSYLNRQLTPLNLDVEIHRVQKTNVQRIECKFKNVLFETGLSLFSAQKLMVMLDVDTNPPRGFNVETSLVNRIFMFTVNHFDLPSLYALKIHACFFRRYTKGRDFYDLLWFLGKKIEPNFKLLNNAIYQTEGKKDLLGEDNFKQFLTEKISKIDFERVKRDASRFLEDKKELDLLDRDIIPKLI